MEGLFKNKIDLENINKKALLLDIIEKRENNFLITFTINKNNFCFMLKRDGLGNYSTLVNNEDGNNIIDNFKYIDKNAIIIIKPNKSYNFSIFLKDNNFYFNIDRNNTNYQYNKITDKSKNNNSYIIPFEILTIEKL